MKEATRRCNVTKNETKNETKVQMPRSNGRTVRTKTEEYAGLRRDAKTKCPRARNNRLRGIARVLNVSHRSQVSEERERGLRIEERGEGERERDVRGIGRSTGPAGRPTGQCGRRGESRGKGE